MTPPHAVGIEQGDRCDICGPQAQGRRGVCMKTVDGKFLIICDCCLTDARAVLTGDDLLRVTREGPLTRIDHGVLADLLEGIAAAAGVVLGMPGVSIEVRLAAANLLGKIRHPEPQPDGSDQG